jgi:hypothetical protein
MQRELVQLARWAAHTGARIAVLVEGRDSAGKGGAIEAIRLRTPSLHEPGSGMRGPMKAPHHPPTSTPKRPEAGEIGFSTTACVAFRLNLWR